MDNKGNMELSDLCESAKSAGLDLLNLGYTEAELKYSMKEIRPEWVSPVLAPLWDALARASFITAEISVITGGPDFYYEISDAMEETGKSGVVFDISEILTLRMQRLEKFFGVDDDNIGGRKKV